MERLVIFNLQDGCSFYALPKMIRTTDSVHLPSFDGNPLCSQGITSMRDGNYVASVSGTRVINIFRTRDGNRAGRLKLPGNLSFPRLLQSLLTTF
jgi:hypothetical protein